MDDALRCLQNLRVVLLDMVTEAQSTYATLCGAAEESLNSKAMTHVDARKASVRAKVGRSDGDVPKSRIPSFVLSKTLPKNTPGVYNFIHLHIMPHSQFTGTKQTNCRLVLNLF